MQQSRRHSDQHCTKKSDSNKASSAERFIRPFVSPTSGGSDQPRQPTRVAVSVLRRDAWSDASVVHTCYLAAGGGASACGAHTHTHVHTYTRTQTPKYTRAHSRTHAHSLTHSLTGAHNANGSCRRCSVGSSLGIRKKGNKGFY